MKNNYLRVIIPAILLGFAIVSAVGLRANALWQYETLGLFSALWGLVLYFVSQRQKWSGKGNLLALSTASGLLLAVGFKMQLSLSLVLLVASIPLLVAERIVRVDKNGASL